jgi:hypothetical protein
MVKLMVKRCFPVLLSILVCLWVWLFPGLPTDAAPSESNILFSVNDLPTGFVAVPATEITDCEPQAEHAKLAAFVFKQGEAINETICISSFELTEHAANESQAGLMRQMMDTILDHPQALIEQALSQQSIDAQLSSQRSNIGDKAASFIMHDGNWHHEILLFRRGDFLSSIAVRYPDAVVPTVSLSAIAMLLDQHVTEYISHNESASPASTKTVQPTIQSPIQSTVQF